MATRPCGTTSRRAGLATTEETSDAIPGEVECRVFQAARMPHEPEADHSLRHVGPRLPSRVANQQRSPCGTSCFRRRGDRRTPTLQSPRRGACPDLTQRIAVDHLVALRTGSTLARSVDLGQTWPQQAMGSSQAMGRCGPHGLAMPRWLARGRVGPPHTGSPQAVGPPLVAQAMRSSQATRGGPTGRCGRTIPRGRFGHMPLPRLPKRGA